MHFDSSRKAKFFRNHVILLIFFMILINLPLNKGEIQTIKVSSDSRSFILFEDFGFTKKGHFFIQLSSISLRSKSMKRMINSSRIGFFLGSSPALESMKEAMFKESCIIGKPSIFPVFTFRDIYLPYQTSYQKNYDVVVPDLYYIFFVNCVPGTSVSMLVNLEIYNINPRGHKDYLGAHFTKLPKYTFTFSMIYFGFLILWLQLCFKNKSFLHKIHLLMSILLLIKFWSMLCSAENQYYVRVSGTPQGWDILSFIFHFIHSLMFVSVVVLIGSGWSLLRPCLHEFQKYMLGMVIFLQVFVNISFIRMRGGGPFYSHYRHWVVTFYAVDFLCGIAIIFPVTDSIETLRETTSKIEGKEARHLAKLRLFRNFHFMLQGYVYTIRMGMFILRVLVKYKHWWVTFAIEQGIDLLFYILMYCNFRPSERNDYIVLGDRDEDFPLTPKQFDF